MEVKPTIWIFSIEPIETRYTGQWYHHVPALLEKECGHKFNIVQIDGVQNNTIPTPGAFLNFSDTNYWKSSQLCKFLEQYNNNKVKKGDKFLFTDAWNPVIIQIKYMSDLLGLDWQIHGLWHAGSWDKEDFLGRIIGNKPWVRHTEKALYYSINHNYFATDFHVKIFMEELLNNGLKSENPWFEQDWEERYIDGKIVKTGWPMEYMADILKPYKNTEKEDIIIFPHRIAPEKQVEIFRDLAESLPQYKFIVCQDNKLTKHEYHSLLGQSKMVFSASKQETLGISMCAEGPILNSIPLCPDFLSYKEIYKSYPEFLYPNEWITDWNAYTKNKNNLINRIIQTMNNFDKYVLSTNQYIDNNYKEYFHSEKLVSILQQL